MDITKPVCNTNSSNTTDCLHKETINYTSLYPFMKDKPTSFSKPQINCEEDALAAVKQDPAVLEAHVTLTGKENNVQSSIHSDEDSVKNEDKGLGESSSAASSESSFEQILAMQKAALLSLKPQQFEFLMMYADSLRKKRLSVNKSSDCAFCKKNGTSVSWYTGHSLKDGRGRVLCPVLRAYRCPHCGATGDRAHTIKYCPGYTILK